MATSTAELPMISAERGRRGARRPDRPHPGGTRRPVPVSVPA